MLTTYSGGGHFFYAYIGLKKVQTTFKTNNQRTRV